jgi:tRNA nucleotidyltransferase/poly(A) polymerase
LVSEYEKVKDFYLSRYLKYSQPLLDGKKIMTLLGIKPSPLVGQILEQLIKVQLEGRVKDQKEAESFVKSFYGKLRG